MVVNNYVWGIPLRSYVENLLLSMAILRTFPIASDGHSLNPISQFTQNEKGEGTE